MTPPTRLAENLSRVRARIAAAADRAGRPPEDIQLIAVTKYVDAEAIAGLLETGCCELGENRPQHLWEKAERLRDREPHWQMIGHLQRNKIRRTLPWITRLHSGDSKRLLQAVDREAAEQGRVVEVLLEVNISGESAKHGFTPAEAETLAPQLSEWPHLRVSGLMGMARQGEPEEVRRDFANLRELRDRLQTLCPSGVELRELSMGMSGDFEIAIEEGATLVRVGSALWEGFTAQ